MTTFRIVPWNNVGQREPNEKWKIAPDFPDYEVSNQGRVRRFTNGSHIKAGAILKQTLGCIGYFKISLYRDKKQNSINVHRLICLAFHGAAPTKNSQVAHFDGNPKNNHANNLRWTDAAGNAQDRIRHGRQDRGTKINTNKLNVSQVKAIRSRAKSGIPQRTIAAEFGITQATVWAIKHRKIWVHV